MTFALLLKTMHGCSAHHGCVGNSKRNKKKKIYKKFTKFKKFKKFKKPKHTCPPTTQPNKNQGMPECAQTQAKCGIAWRGSRHVAVSWSDW